MQIQYDLTKGYFNYYNESQGIMIYRNKLLKNNNIKIHSFLMYLVKNVVFLLLPFAFDICFYLIDPENLFSKLLNILLCILIFLLIFYFFLFYIGYLKEKKKARNGILLFGEKGITDNINEKNVHIKWKNIKALVIHKYTLTFLTDKNIYFMINVENKEKVLKAIDKYNKQLKIIDRSLKNERFKSK